MMPCILQDTLPLNLNVLKLKLQIIQLKSATSLAHPAEILKDKASSGDVNI